MDDVYITGIMCVMVCHCWFGVYETVFNCLYTSLNDSRVFDWMTSSLLLTLCVVWCGIVGWGFMRFSLTHHFHVNIIISYLYRNVLLIDVKDIKTIYLPNWYVWLNLFSVFVLIELFLAKIEQCQYILKETDYFLLIKTPLYL